MAALDFLAFLILGIFNGFSPILINKIRILKN